MAEPTSLVATRPPRRAEPVVGTTRPRYRAASAPPRSRCRARARALRRVAARRSRRIDPCRVARRCRRRAVARDPGRVGARAGVHAVGRGLVPLGRRSRVSDGGRVPAPPLRRRLLSCLPGADPRASRRSTGLSTLHAAILVSFVLGAAATVLVWQLAARLVGREKANRATALFVFFPGAFVLSMAYAETLMIVAAAACLLLLLDRRWTLGRCRGRSRNRNAAERHRGPDCLCGRRGRRHCPPSRVAGAGRATACSRAASARSSPICGCGPATSTHGSNPSGSCGTTTSAWALRSCAASEACSRDRRRRSIREAQRSHRHHRHRAGDRGTGVGRADRDAPGRQGVHDRGARHSGAVVRGRASTADAARRLSSGRACSRAGCRHAPTTSCSGRPSSFSSR